MFIPIKDDNPTIRKPYLTVTLIAINTLIFLYSISQGSRGFSIITYQFGFIPFELLNSIELTPQFSASYYLTPFSSMFMHGGWMHLIGNMLFLWIYGNNMEDFLGPAKFLFFYIAGGLAAVALFTLFAPSSQVPLIGASGAIAGVMGGYVVLWPRAKVTVLVVFFFIQFIQVSAKTLLGIWFVYQVLMGVLSNSSGGGVAWMAHVGGFLFGWLLIKIITRFKGKGTTPSGGQRVYKMDWQ